MCNGKRVWQKPSNTFHNRFYALLSIVVASSVGFAYPCAVWAADEINFKVYDPDKNKGGTDSQTNTSNQNSTDATADSPKPASQAQGDTPPVSNSSTQDSQTNTSSSKNGLTTETPVVDSSATSSKSKDSQPSSTASTSSSTTSATKDAGSDSTASGSSTDSTAKSSGGTTSTADNTNDAESDTPKTANKVLQGYIKVVPSGTKIPIIMDTAVDSDTSQEGDEFSARTSEDLTIDGTNAVPAGSIIRGRIASINAPKHLDRSGSVALKFDTITTPDNHQIPLVANLVARGGVVHARRGLKDIAIDAGVFTLPTAAGLGIGAIAGHSSSSVGTAGGALIGAGVGAAIGLAVLLAKKGKKIDVRPGDELKIELAEDLHLPTL